MENTTMESFTQKKKCDKDIYECAGVIWGGGGLTSNFVGGGIK